MTRHAGPRTARLAVAVLAVPLFAALTSSSTVAPVAGASSPAPPSSPAVQECEDEAPGWSARVRPGAKQPEPPAYATSEAKKYATIPDAPTLADGSVVVETVFHVITDEPTTGAERSRLEDQVAAQMAVLNGAYSGATAQDVDAADTGGSDTPFRFDLVQTTWTANEDWAALSPGKEEKKMKKALYRGDARTLNVYVTGLQGGLLGFSYFPSSNKGPRYLDGVVMLDGTLPGGYAGPYGEGDTLVHETGHWLALEHTFEGGCSEEGDGVADTPAEAEPQFGCPVGADTCPAPGLDPVHNFMDYVDDACMYEFTPGQADRMSDAWVAFRADGKR